MVLYLPPVHYADSVFCRLRAPRLDIAQATIKQMPSYELHGVLGQTYNVFRSKDSGNSNAIINASSQVGAQMQVQMSMQMLMQRMNSYHKPSLTSLPSCHRRTWMNHSGPMRELMRTTGSLISLPQISSSTNTPVLLVAWCLVHAGC